MATPADSGPTMRQKFRDVCLELGAEDERVVMVFGDISVFLFREFSARWPERFFNAGICENTLISLAAGMSAQGYHPFVHSINPFVTERSLEQIKLDLCYNGFGGNIVTCGASFDYAWDGSSHHSYSELALLGYIPDIEIMQPGNADEFAALLRSRYDNGRASYFRTSEFSHGERFPIRFGTGVVVRDAGAPVTVLTSGPLLREVLAGCVDLPVNLLYFHTLKPLDLELLERYRHTRMLVVEDAHGLSAALGRVPDLQLSRHGLPDRFLTSYGTAAEIRADLGLDAAGIRQAVQRRLEGAPSRDTP